MKRHLPLVFGMLLFASCAGGGSNEPALKSINGEWITYSTATPLLLETYNIDFPYKAEGLASLIEGCGRTVDPERVERVAAAFADSLGIAYVFTPTDGVDGRSGFIATVFPNEMRYASMDEFNADFELCWVAGDFYPKEVTAEHILFVNSCGSGAGGPTDCDRAREALGDSVKLATR